MLKLVFTAFFVNDGSASTHQRIQRGSLKKLPCAAGTTCESEESCDFHPTSPQSHWFDVRAAHAIVGSRTPVRSTKPAIMP